MSRPPISYTRITSNKPELLSKYFSLEGGVLIKKSSANMREGTSETIYCADLSEFCAQLATFTGSQAACYGIAPGHPTASIRSEKELRPGDIARTTANFKYPSGPGIMMLDHDGTQDGVPLDPLVLRDTLIAAVPELADAPMLWTTSSSSCISTTEGEVLNSIRGQRLYLAVDDATLIPQAGKALIERLWAAGLGWVHVGKAGQALNRTLFDAAVWQSNRLDFVGPPELAEGLIRTPPPPMLFGDQTQLFDLSKINASPEVLRKARAAQVAAKNAVKVELATARAAYIARKAPELAARDGVALVDAEAMLTRALDQHVLTADYALLTDDDTIVTVAELLADPDKWDQVYFADPVEPDYRDFDCSVARAHLKPGTMPHIYSFAHGGTRYILARAVPRILVAAGQRARVADEVLSSLRKNGDIYDFGEGGSMARVANKSAIAVTRDWLMDYIDRNCDFYRLRPLPTGGFGEAPVDCLPGVATAILAKQGERNFPKLDTVITAPTLRLDGSILDDPGYDAASRLLYISDGHGYTIPVTPTVEDAILALKCLWAPLEKFPFVGADDRGVALAGMLTAVIRGSLPTAPGFAFDAPAAGSGKTLLAKVLGILATGQDPAISSPAIQEEEMRKRLFAQLREGARVIVLDNVNAPLGGASLDAFLTAPNFTDRVLGVSETASLPNRALFVVTGNNVRVIGDTGRRILKARIDTKSEKPYAREFFIDPADYVRRHRQQLVCHALTIIRAYIAAGSPRLGKGKTASFEDWDNLVRQPVLWIASEAVKLGGLPGFADPIDVIERQSAEEPEVQKLDAFMHSWHAAFGDKPTTVATATKHWSSFDDTALQDALDEIAGQNGRVNARILGRWIERNRERLHNGYRIERGTKRDGNTTWIVSKVKAEVEEPTITH